MTPFGNRRRTTRSVNGGIDGRRDENRSVRNGGPRGSGSKIRRSFRRFAHALPRRRRSEARHRDVLSWEWSWRERWSNFKGNAPAFNEAGYRTLMPDTIGYGYSSKPAEAAFTLQDCAAHYKGVADAAGADKLTLVGNSQGGAIAIAFARAYPERVEKLILMAPGGLETREVYMEMVGIKSMIKAIYKDGISRDSLKKVFALQLFNESLINETIIDERLQIAETQQKNVLASIRVDNQEEHLGELTMPVLCFWGVDDKFCPMSGATKVATCCPNSRTVLISQCGHWVMVEYPKLFNETSIRFLNGTLG
ncbi:MAG: alpha/beta hydrolase [Polyangiales bacterium]